MRRHYPRITEVYHNPHSPQNRLRIKRTRSFVNVYGSFYLRGGNSVMIEPTKSRVSYETRCKYTQLFQIMLFQTAKKRIN